MGMAPDTGQRVAAILNAAWLVRHYARGGRVRSTSPMAVKRSAAIRELGLQVREHFNSSEDFESLLAAVVDGLRPRDDQPPF